MKLRSHLESNPINAWTGGAGTGGDRYFDYSDHVFSSRVVVVEHHRPRFATLVREIAEWRLAEYLDRPSVTTEEGHVIKVNQASGRPILFPLERGKNTSLPRGWTDVVAGGQSYVANFVEQAVNVIRRPGSEDNIIASLLRGWFGSDAGAPGTRHQVRLRDHESGKWLIEPIGAGVLTPVLWKSYAREQIPAALGFDFNRSIWQQGFVRRDNRTFLLVFVWTKVRPSNPSATRIISWVQIASNGRARIGPNETVEMASQFVITRSWASTCTCSFDNALSCVMGPPLHLHTAASWISLHGSETIQLR